MIPSTSAPDDIDLGLKLRPKFRFPAIRPSLPAVADWSRHFAASYAERWFSNFGPVSLKFEAGLTAKFCHAGEVVTCANSATSGIAAALIALDVRGIVVVPAFTFPATGSAVLMAGAEPVVIDVELATWNLAPSLLRQFITTQTCAAVVLVSPFGLHCDFSEQIEICRGHGIPVVIDSAAGLSQKGQPLIDERCFEIYSLHATKPFPIGEGGAIRSWASQAPALRRALNFGLEGGRGQLGCWGINGKLPEVSAAIGLAVLSEFDAIVRHRQAIAGRYIECLREYPALVFPSHLDHSPWQVFPVLLPSASAAEIFIQRAGAERLQIRWSYKPTLDNWPRTRRSGACPNAQSLAERMVTLPVYSDMTKDELSEILGIVQRSLDHALQA